MSKNGAGHDPDIEDYPPSLYDEDDLTDPEFLDRMGDNDGEFEDEEGGFIDDDDEDTFL